VTTLDSVVDFVQTRRLEPAGWLVLAGKVKGGKTGMKEILSYLFKLMLG
jgi:hypothetical protein